MEKYFVILLLVGVAFAARPAHHGKKVKLPVTVSPQGDNAQEGDHASADAQLDQVYHHLMQRLHEIETNTDLTERQKKQQLAGLSHEIRKFVSALSGVPLKMIDHPLPNEDAEQLRQQFLTSVHEIINNHDISFEEKKALLSPKRTEYADGMKALGLHSPEKHKAAVNREKLLRSRAHADVMTGLLHNIQKPGVNTEVEKHQLKQAMIDEMRMLHGRYGDGKSASHPADGTESGPSHPVHHKQKRSNRK